MTFRSAAIACLLLTGADVQVAWHPWAEDDSPSSTIDVTSSFDLSNGTVRDIHLPRREDGVVGLVTITPKLDMAARDITCPGDISQGVDPGPKAREEPAAAEPHLSARR